MLCTVHYNLFIYFCRQAKKSAPSRLPSEGDVDEDDWGMADVEGEAEAAVVDKETGGGGGSGATGENKSPESSRCCWGR